MCHRRSGGCSTAYNDAPERDAASSATASVPFSRLPPWNAMKPNRDRSSHSSSTPSWASSSANIGPPTPRRGPYADEHRGDGEQDHDILVVLQPVAHGEGPVRDTVDGRVVRRLADLDPSVPRDVRA